MEEDEGCAKGIMRGLVRMGKKRVWVNAFDCVKKVGVKRCACKIMAADDGAGYVFTKVTECGAEGCACFIR